MSIVVLGIDIATLSGVATIKDNKLVYFNKFKISNKEYKYRFKEFKQEINKLIVEYKPQAIAIEQTYVSVNPKTTAYLNMLRGICIYLIPNKTELYSDAVSRIRKETMGQGTKYTKYDVFDFIIKKYKLELDKEKDLDITDAILLADWAYTKELTRVK